MNIRNLLNAFAVHVRRRPDAVALIGEDPNDAARLQSHSWRELGQRVVSAAGRLRHLVDRESAQDRLVAHRCDNRDVDVVIALASMAAGAIEVPFDELPSPDIDQRKRRIGGVWLDPEAKEWVTRGGEAFGLAADGDVSGWLQKQSIAIDPDRPSLLLWTSGTTESPRAVTLSQRNLTGNALAKLAAVPQTVADVRLTTLPLAHAYARTCDLGTWLLSGCTLAVTRGFGGWCRVAPQVRPTMANTVPQLARRLADEDPKKCGLDRLVILGCGGAALAREQFVDWRRRGVTVIQGYGLTEAAPVICSATPHDARPGWVGRPVAGWEVQLRDGRLFVRGSHTMLGYWGDPDATARKVDQNGWLDTGDLTQRDSATGQFRIVGRADDVIVLENGRKVHPGPIEREVGRINGVRHAVLVAVPTGLEVWLDVDSAVDFEGEVLPSLRSVCGSLPRWQRPSEVRRLTPPLSQEAGELTAKGTVRRAAVLSRLTRMSAVDRSPEQLGYIRMALSCPKVDPNW